VILYDEKSNFIIGKNEITKILFLLRCDEKKVKHFTSRKLTIDEIAKIIFTTLLPLTKQIKSKVV